MTENLFVKNQFGEKLETVVRTPKKTGKFPAVLFVSGFGMDLHEYKNSNDEVAKRLNNSGFATVQFSFAGRGASEGDYREMTLDRQAKQIDDMVSWLRDNPDINKNRIGIYAESFGVPSTMSANLRNISSLCFISGVYNVDKNMRRVFVEERGAIIVENGETNLPRSNGSVTVVGKQFFPSLDSFNPKLNAREIFQPVFAVHGSLDTKISPSEVQSIFWLFPNPNKQLKIYRKGDHGIMDVPRRVREEFLIDVVEWFGKTL
jgi:pimeloyl-ACP methyl ester carboxylesterase